MGNFLCKINVGYYLRYDCSTDGQINTRITLLYVPKFYRKYLFDPFYPSIDNVIARRNDTEFQNRATKE